MTQQTYEIDLSRIPPTLQLDGGEGDGSSCACATSAGSLALVGFNRFTDAPPGQSPLIRRLSQIVNDDGFVWGTGTESARAERTRVIMPRDEHGIVRADSLVAKLLTSAASPEVETWRACVALHRSLCVWLPDGLDGWAKKIEPNNAPRAAELRKHATTLREVSPDRLRADSTGQGDALAALADLDALAALADLDALADLADLADLDALAALADLDARAALAALDARAALAALDARAALAALDALDARAALAALADYKAARRAGRDKVLELIHELIDLREVQKP